MNACNFDRVYEVDGKFFNEEEYNKYVFSDHHFKDILKYRENNTNNTNKKKNKKDKINNTNVNVKNLGYNVHSKTTIQNVKIE